MPGVTGIVLAGGRSRRFGRNKLAEPFRGRPLVHHAVAAVASVSQGIVVSVASDAALPSLPEGVPARFAHDDLRDQGPLSGLASALKEVRSPLALVVGGDMPDLSPAVLRRMIDVAAADEEADAVVLADEDIVRPLPCVLKTRVTGDIAALVSGGERRLRALLGLAIRAIPEAEWRLLDPEGGTLRDVDRPGDVQA